MFSRQGQRGVRSRLARTHRLLTHYLAASILSLDSADVRYPMSGDGFRRDANAISALNSCVCIPGCPIHRRRTPCRCAGAPIRLFWTGLEQARDQHPRLTSFVLWSHPPGLNRRPADYESAALPTELGWLFLGVINRAPKDEVHLRSYHNAAGVSATFGIVRVCVTMASRSGAPQPHANLIYSICIAKSGTSSSLSSSG